MHKNVRNPLKELIQRSPDLKAVAAPGGRKFPGGLVGSRGSEGGVADSRRKRKRQRSDPSFQYPVAPMHGNKAT